MLLDEEEDVVIDVRLVILYIFKSLNVKINEKPKKINPNAPNIY